MSKRPYYARYDERYKQVRELGMKAFKRHKGCIKTDIRLLDAFLSWGKRVKKAKRVIEFGCGDGYLAVHLAKKGYSVVAFDYSEAAIQGCKELARKAKVKVDFRVGNALGIKWAKDKSFDLGVSNNVFQMFATSRDRGRHTIEMNRVLKPGAPLYLNCPAGRGARPDRISSIKEHRKQREFCCDLTDRKGRTWPEVASWGPDLRTAVDYFCVKGFRTRYIHWEDKKAYGYGLRLYLEKD